MEIPLRLELDYHLSPSQKATLEQVANSYGIEFIRDNRASYITLSQIKELKELIDNHAINDDAVIRLINYLWCCF